MFGQLKTSNKSAPSSSKRERVELPAYRFHHVAGMLLALTCQTTTKSQFITLRERSNSSSLRDLRKRSLILRGPSGLKIWDLLALELKQLSSGIQQTSRRSLIRQAHLAKLLCAAWPHLHSTKKGGATQEEITDIFKSGLTLAPSSSRLRLIPQPLLESLLRKDFWYLVAKTKRLQSYLLKEEISSSRNYWILEHLLCAVLIYLTATCSLAWRTARSLSIITRLRRKRQKNTL